MEVTLIGVLARPVWWHYTSFSQSIWILQFCLGVFKAITHRKKNSELFHGYLRPKEFISDNFLVLYIVILWNISFPRWCFLAFYWLHQQYFSFCQPWWQPLVNSSLISQFWESINHVNSLNFLANALLMNISFESNALSK